MADLRPLSALRRALEEAGFLARRSTLVMRAVEAGLAIVGHAESGWGELTTVPAGFVLRDSVEILPRSNSTTMFSVVSDRAAIQRVPPGPERPSTKCSMGWFSVPDFRHVLATDPCLGALMPLRGEAIHAEGI